MKKLANKHIRGFQNAVWRFYEKGRRKFPWRPPSLKLRKDGTADPHAVLVSEVMLQQTQAQRVAPFFRRFMRVFPTVRTLAAAPLKEVSRAWQGLGYNRRALHLKRAAELLAKNTAAGYRAMQKHSIPFQKSGDTPRMQCLHFHTICPLQSLKPMSVAFSCISFSFFQNRMGVRGEETLKLVVGNPFSPFPTFQYSAEYWNVGSRAAQEKGPSGFFYPKMARGAYGHGRDD